MTETKTPPGRTSEEIWAEKLALEEQLKQDLPFCEQEKILKRIVDLLKERQEVMNAQ
jgi:hypothetical protein